MITKIISLNKAAVIMKKAKAKQNEALMQTGVVLYPIDAVSGKNPEGIRKQILTKIETAKKVANEAKDAIMFYADIKERLIAANVDSGLHSILCQLDMFKNMKSYLEMVLNYEASKAVQNSAHNTKGMSHLLLDEECVTEVILFNKFIEDVIQDITRPDSKQSYMNAIISIPMFGEPVIKEALVNIQKAVNNLEDKKYEINNTHRIAIDIPDSLVEYLGF